MTPRSQCEHYEEDIAEPGFHTISDEMCQWSQNMKGSKSVSEKSPKLYQYHPSSEPNVSGPRSYYGWMEPLTEKISTISIESNFCYWYSEFVSKMCPIENGGGEGPDPCASFEIMIGVMSTTEQVRLRNLHRTASAAANKHSCVVFKYVIGGKNLSSDELESLKKENLDHSDIVLLDTKENIDEGKTLDWFDFALKNYGHMTHFGKMELDAWVSGEELVNELRRIKSSVQKLGNSFQYLFYGRANGAKTGSAAYMFGCGAMVFWKNTPSEMLQYPNYMRGMFYLISNPVLQGLSAFSPWKQLRVGIEDQVVGQHVRSWAFDLDCGQNLIPVEKQNETFPLLFADEHEKFVLKPEDVREGSIAVHGLKTENDWKTFQGGKFVRSENLSEESTSHRSERTGVELWQLLKEFTYKFTLWQRRSAAKMESQDYTTDNKFLLVLPCSSCCSNWKILVSWIVCCEILY